MKAADLGAHLGQEIGVSSWITVDQQRIDEFAHCTGDHQRIHVDVERSAQDSAFGTTVAHGVLTLSLLAPTSFETMISRLEVKQAINYGLEKVRFLAPVRAGKRVRNRIRIAALEDKGGGRTLLTTENTIEIESEDKPAAIAFAKVMLMSGQPWRAVVETNTHTDETVSRKAKARPSMTRAKVSDRAPTKKGLKPSTSRRAHVRNIVSVTRDDAAVKGAQHAEMPPVGKARQRHKRAGNSGATAQ